MGDFGPHEYSKPPIFGPHKDVHTCPHTVTRRHSPPLLCSQANSTPPTRATRCYWWRHGWVLAGCSCMTHERFCVLVSTDVTNSGGKMCDWYKSDLRSVGLCLVRRETLTLTAASLVSFNDYDYSSEDRVAHLLIWTLVVWSPAHPGCPWAAHKTQRSMWLCHRYKSLEATE